MILEKDYKDFINIFIEEKVQFLLVGGYAVGLHGHPRPTRDLDDLKSLEKILERSRAK